MTIGYTVAGQCVANEDVEVEADSATELDSPDSAPSASDAAAATGSDDEESGLVLTTTCAHP